MLHRLCGVTADNKANPAQPNLAEVGVGAELGKILKLSHKKALLEKLILRFLIIINLVQRQYADLVHVKCENTSIQSSEW